MRILALLEQCQKFLKKNGGRRVAAALAEGDGRCLATFRFSFRSVGRLGGRARAGVAKQSSTGWCCARSLQEQLGEEQLELLLSAIWVESIISIILTKVAQVCWISRIQTSQSPISSCSSISSSIVIHSEFSMWLRYYFSFAYKILWVR